MRLRCTQKEYVCVYLRIMYEILHKRRCQQVHSSTNTKWCIGICVCACVSTCVCVFVCLRTILFPHYPTVSSSPALMRSLTVTVVIKVKPRPTHRKGPSRSLHSHSLQVYACPQLGLAAHLQSTPCTIQIFSKERC